VVGGAAAAEPLRDVGEVVRGAPRDPARRGAGPERVSRPPGDLPVAPGELRALRWPVVRGDQGSAQVVEAVVAAASAPSPPIDPPNVVGGVPHGGDRGAGHGARRRRGYAVVAVADAQLGDPLPKFG